MPKSLVWFINKNSIMRSNKAIEALVFLASLFVLSFIECIISTHALAGERIVYTIRPFGGRAEYNDKGIVELDGKPAKLTVFKTSYLGFEDTERIFCDPETFFALKVERDISGWLGNENIVEEYNQVDYTVTIKKFKDGKQVTQQLIRQDGPIYNAVTLPFYVRHISTPSLGWTFKFRIPELFEVTLVSVDTIRISGKTYRAYHFVSSPKYFELWVDSKNPYIPLKITGRRGLSYRLTLNEYSKD